MQGEQQVGGLIGFAENGSVRDSLALNPEVDGDSTTGKVIGTKGSKHSAVNIALHEKIGGKSHTLYADKLFEESDTGNTKAFPNIDFENIWVMNENGLPSLRSNDNRGLKQPVYSEVATVVFHEGSLYNAIRNAHDLQNISPQGPSILLNDIDLSGINWQPIGTSSNRFSGTLDGNGHTIKNLTINSTNSYNVGLFSSASRATFKNLTIENPRITSTGNQVGALVGYLFYGEINNVFVEGGVVRGKEDVGGLAGHLYFTQGVKHTSSSSEVEGTLNTGGLVGRNNNNPIQESYATGKVKGGNNSGGLIGHLESGELTNSYATGDVTGALKVGGLVGQSGDKNLEGVV